VSREHDFDRQLADWLGAGPLDAPGRAIDAAVAHARAHPRRQRTLGSLWRAVRDSYLDSAAPGSHRTSILAFNAIVAVVVVGLAGAFLLDRGQGNPAVPGPSPAAAAAPSAASPSPSAAATPMSSMTAQRASQTATLLADGRVLIAGGIGSVKQGNLTLQGEVVASAELYEPKTATFTATGSMTTPRAGHTATLLADGRVLLSGGYDVDGALASAELYDPKTGTFSPTGSMTVPREQHTATLLVDGRILIAGGDDGSNALNTAEIFDPKTFTFSLTGPMTTARTEAAATLLSDGRVLIAGGVGPRTSSPNQTSAEVYDPKTGTFTATGSMTTARNLQTMTLLADGRVLVAGGSDNIGHSINIGQGLASAELYEPKTGTFRTTGSMTAARFEQTATVLPNGRVLVAGGFIDGGITYTNPVVASLVSVDLYDPTAGTFSATGSMSTPRAGQTATLLADGRVLIAGGFTDTAGPSLASAELYDPKTSTFGPPGP
jgi:hypothetical protein